MVKLRSRRNHPVNGWWFTDPAISSDAFQAHDFNSLVSEVIRRRQNNPRFKLATDQATVANEVDAQNALRMLSIRGADSYVMEAGGGPSPNFQARRQGPRVGLAAGVNNVRTGAATLMDWLGEGGQPVEVSLAHSRAAVCAECPQNGKGDWSKWFTSPAAELIRQQVSIKNDLSLTTPSDDKLGVCEACGCKLNLKCWVPLKHVAEHMNEEVKSKLDGGCWVLKELKT